MSNQENIQKQLLNDAVHWLNAQASSHRTMMNSKPVRHHAVAIMNAVAALRNALAKGDFATLLRLEMEIQQLELARYSNEPGIMATIERTREDLAEGIRDYAQLAENPASYCARGYRKRDRTGAGGRFPLDTMRKALRSQAARVGNFARNPMLGPEEKDFHRVRVSILKRAEKLYEELQARALAAHHDTSQE